MPMQFCYDPSKPVRENDHVLLVDHKRNKFVVKVEPNSYFKICKDRFNLGMLIGCQYGQMFTKYDNNWIKICEIDERFKRYRDIIHLSEGCEDEQLKDNRYFLLNNTAQKLTPDEIVQMKKEVNTFDLITKIVENSETFHARTIMAQEKYIKRKEHRHLKLFVVSHCNLMSICESYFNAFPHKIGYMRYESLGMMFHLANIQLNDNVIVFDHSLGLLTAGVSQKLNGTGMIYRLVTKGVSDKIVHEIGINHYSNILSIDINDFFSDNINAESDVNPRQSEKATVSGIYPLYKVNMDQLKVNVIIGNISFNKCNKNNALVEEYTINLVKIANKYLQDDGKFVLFGQHLQPMVECYAQLNSNSYINTKLDEIFFREYQVITQDIKDVLLKCKNNGYNLALVSGSDIVKVKRQLGTEFLTNFIYIFCENGTQAYRDGELFSSENILNHISDELLKELVNFTLCYIANLDIPKKRGCFFECRKSLINISPIGRNCSYDERNEFFEFDNKVNIRKAMKYELERRFKDRGLEFAIGGKISIDCYPKGWSKVFVLKFLDDFDEIHFFGDMVHPGGNDHELYIHKRIIGHEVTSYNDTVNKLKAFT